MTADSLVALGSDLDNATDEQLAAAAAALAGGDSPESQDLRGDLLWRLAARVMMRPAGLLAEAAAAGALAAVQRKIRDAEAALTAADDEVAPR